ncbi:potassium channel family protein [Paramaledivibacter caminithermalis]|jgi:voltage-gated potassium channel|uniref:Voltage-gated potassium channel n=1 Tax=Paramaledivibacter caminithermalis (strain DSM 15212 / CIP 107654 / DViRD3) TaxID=1121301 RepID=A0A1M6S7P0_PARC5|nr:potassium channel family protein [Paramaledivibacter caminithermalis]SHK40792.1 voltage-gated potassium channel [Paramaledivibacter caminithermalis DSM 15212]
MLFIFINRIKALHISLGKNNLYRLLTLGLVSLLIFSTSFYFCEKSINPDLSFSDALWWGFVTCTTVGYGDYYPLTPRGRIIGIFLMLIGISIFGFLTATIASIFIENKLKEGMGLMDIKFNGHIAIIGWNDKSRIMLEELVQDNPNRNIVIIDEIEKLSLNHKNTFFVHGDPTKDETLLKANIPHADTVIVVADESMDNYGMSDAKSVLICLAVDKFNTNAHLIAEVLNEENIPHFKRANVNDIIITNQMSSRIMVRSALYKNVSHALKELLTASYGNEIYERKVENEDIGLTFKDIVSKYIENYDSIVLGIANKNILLNPDKNYIIQEKDIIIYISKNKL